jgi:hypothetical protein
MVMTKEKVKMRIPILLTAAILVVLSLVSSGTTGSAGSSSASKSLATDFSL